MHVHIAIDLGHHISVCYAGRKIKQNMLLHAALFQKLMF